MSAAPTNLTRSVRPWADLNTWAIPRPRWSGFFESNIVALGVDFGNGHSDPIVSFGVEIRLRPRLAGWLDWLLPDHRRNADFAKGWFTRR